MYCPTCGKVNPAELKFCASCGTNLALVSQALTGREDNFLARIDSSVDQFIARYSERIFKNASEGLPDHKVSKSWKLLGQGVLTSFVELLLFVLMWNFLPIRFLLLLISTPVRLLADRGRQQHTTNPPIQAYKPPEIAEPKTGLWLTDAAPSVTEGTTSNLTSVAPTEDQPTPVTDRLKR
jgi:hypothetical protein